MEIYLLKILSMAIVFFGIFLISRRHLVINKLKSFYSKYPLVRYAGEKQLTSRPHFVIGIGIVFILLGIICCFTIN